MPHGIPQTAGFFDRSQVTGHRLQVTGLKMASVEFAVTYNSDGVMSEKYNMGECNCKIFNT